MHENSSKNGSRSRILRNTVLRTWGSRLSLLSYGARCTKIAHFQASWILDAAMVCWFIFCAKRAIRGGASMLEGASLGTTTQIQSTWLLERKQILAFVY